MKKRYPHNTPEDQINLALLYYYSGSWSLYTLRYYMRKWHGLIVVTLDVHDITLAV